MFALMKKQTLLLLLLSGGTWLLQAQSGGDNIWDFLNVPVSARATSLGGQHVGIYDDDLNWVYNNPSLLNSSMNNQLTMNYADYLADIRFGYISYARSFKRLGNLGMGLYHIDYGKFTEADEYGNQLGTFNQVYDYSVNAFYSREVVDSLLQIGGTLKTIGSKYQYWNAFGAAIDLSATYHNDPNQFAAALVVKNIGGQINTFYDGSGQEPLPFEVQLGLSKKLLHAPFRFSLLLRNLETPNLRYETEAEIDQRINSETPTPEPGKLTKFGDNAMRHAVFGVEFVPTKNFNLRLGYNYKRREELKIPDKTGMVGFSWGFGMKIYKFHISYGRARYHLAAVTNHFTLAIKLDEFSNKY